MRKLTFVTLIILSFANCSPSCPRPLSWIDLLNTNVDHQLLIEAAQTWNDAVQVELFKWSYRGGTVQVWEYPNVTMPDWRPGEPDIYTGRADSTRGVDGVIEGICRVFLQENDHDKFSTLVHELGHCLPSR